MANAREDVHSYDWNRVVFFNSKNAIMLFPVPRFDLLGILFDLLHFIVELLVDFVSCILIVLLQGRHNFAVPLKLLHDAFVELLFDDWKEEQTPQWYISHWWGEPVRDFVASERAHAEARVL